MNKEIYSSPIFSIKPVYLEKILTKEKIFEFRNTYPKKFANYFWIYESSPTKALKYLMEVELPIQYPEKIASSSYGVERFNSGVMNANYAYRIKHLYKIKNQLTRKELISEFEVIPPQSYTYMSNYPKLQERMKSNELIKLY